MCNKAILILLATLGLSFNAYAEEVETQQFYDRELLTETLTADDQEALAAAQEANQIALETDQAAADAAAESGRQGQLQKEADLVSFLEEQGMAVYEPDLAAFRTQVQSMYLESEFASTWPDGVLDKINALGN